MDYQLLALEKRERFVERRERIVALYHGDPTRGSSCSTWRTPSTPSSPSTSSAPSARSRRPSSSTATTTSSASSSARPTSTRARPRRRSTYFRRVLEVKPDHYEGLVYSGVIHYERGDHGRRRGRPQAGGGALPGRLPAALRAWAPSTPTRATWPKAAGHLERAVECAPVPQARYPPRQLPLRDGRSSRRRSTSSRRPSATTPASRRPSTTSGPRLPRPPLEPQGARGLPAGAAPEPQAAPVPGPGAPTRAGTPGRRCPEVDGEARRFGKAEENAGARQPQAGARLYRRALSRRADNPTLLMSYALLCLHLDRSQEIEPAPRRSSTATPARCSRRPPTRRSSRRCAARASSARATESAARLLDESASSFTQTIAYYEMAYNLAEMEEDLDEALDYAGRSLGPRRTSSSSFRSPRSAGSTTSARSSTRRSTSCAVERARRRAHDAAPPRHGAPRRRASGGREGSVRAGQTGGARRGLEERMMEHAVEPRLVETGRPRAEEAAAGSGSAAGGRRAAASGSKASRERWYLRAPCAGPATSCRPPARCPTTPRSSRTILMMRAGMIKKVAAGIYTYRRSAGARTGRLSRSSAGRSTAPARSRSSCPILQPARAVGGERALAALRQEEILFASQGPPRAASSASRRRAEEVRHRPGARRASRRYRQLPVTLYQIRTKFRDEIRPRFGLMRGREFLMNDGYSFDADAEGLDALLQGAGRAYRRDLRALRPRLHGGRGRHGRDRRHARRRSSWSLAETGERRRRPLRRLRLRGERREGGDGPSPGALEGRDRGAARRGGDAGQGRHRRRRGVPRDHRGADDQDASSTRPTRASSWRSCAATSRSTRSRSRNVLDVEHLALATEEKVEGATGAPVGYVGPHKLPPGQLRASSPTSRSATRSTPSPAPAGATGTSPVSSCGATRTSSEWGVVRAGARGDPCPRCGKPLSIARGIEVGHIFKLGTKYSKALACDYTDEQGESHPMVMGCYGIGDRPHDGRGGRAEPRRRRHRLAAAARALRGRCSCRSTRRTPRLAEAADALYDGARDGGHRRPLRRPRRAARRQVQGRRPDRLPDPRQRRRPRPQGRQGRGRRCRRDKNVRTVAAGRRARGGAGAAGRARRKG